MAHKIYLALSGAIFLLVGVFHLLRLAYGWPIVVGASTIPYGLSYVGAPFSLGYSVWAAWLLHAMARGRSGTRR
jgi:hypothetical protein